MNKAMAAAAALTLALSGCGAPTRTATVLVGAELAFTVKVADSAAAQRTGLQGREELPEGTGMLFDFAERSDQEVWMAGMLVAIDVAWIADGRVVATDTLEPCLLEDQAQCPRWASPGPVDALLEVPAGALAAVSPGDTVSLQ